MPRSSKMHDDLRPQSAPCPDPGGTYRPGRILSMKAADPYNHDAITAADLRPIPHKSTVSLHSNASFKDKEGATERRDASVALGESQHISRKRAEAPTGADSPGYMRMEILRSHILPSEKTFILALVMVLATAHSLDNFLRVLYQFEVTMFFQNNGILAAVNTISTLSTATLTPMISKSADVFGRPHTLLVSVVSYVLGTALQAVSNSIGSFCIGTVFWTIGFLGVISMFEIIIADITSMRLRVIMFYLPALPYLVTTWVSAPLRNTLVEVCPQWQRRFEWSAIVYTVCSLPLLVAIFTIERRTKRRLPLSQKKNIPDPKKKTFRDCIALFLLRFQQMDILGWICFVGIVSCILAPWPGVPVVEPRSKKLWTSPAMIAVFTTGLLCIPMFCYIEKYAKYPMFPPQLLGEKRILTALIMGFLYHLAYYAQHTYLYIGLIVRYDESQDVAARTVGVYTFTSTLIGLFMGVILSITRDLRWYLRIGAIFYLASFIIQMTHPSGLSNADRLAVSSSQVLLGVAGGLFPFPAMAFVQAARAHTQLSTLIGAYMTACRIGGGIGQALAGAIWTNALKPRLRKALAGVAPESEIEMLYAIPTDIEEIYPWDSKPRSLIVDTFVKSHRYLCAVGIIASTLLIILAFLIRDASLEEESQEEAGIELWAHSGDDVELRAALRARATPSPLRPSRLPILM